MVGSNTETRITVTYDDSNGTLNFVEIMTYLIMTTHHQVFQHKTGTETLTNKTI